MSHPDHVDSTDGSDGYSDGHPDAPGDHPEPRQLGKPVVVRRNAGLAALLGAAASTIAIAYLWRATETAAPLDWALCVVMAAIAAVYLAGLVDARTPLLVADDLGVRIRLGNQWRGLPWDAVGTVVVKPRRGLLRDGRLIFAPHSLARALDGLDGRGRRAAALNQKVYGAALAVPMGLTTRFSAQGQELTDDLAALAEGRAEVVVVEPETRPDDHPEESPTVEVEQAAWDDEPATYAADQPVEGDDYADDYGDDVNEDAADETDATGETDEADEDRPVRRRGLGRLGTLVSRVARGRSHDVDAQTHEDDDTETEDTDQTDQSENDEGEVDEYETGLDETGVEEDEAYEPTPHVDAPVQPAGRSAIPLRKGPWRLRADVTRESPAALLGNAALLPDHHDRDDRRSDLPERRELRRPNDVPSDVHSDVQLRGAAPRGFDDGRVRPISALGDPVEALVIDDYAVEPAYDPVIGPELAAARTRVGLSVDELADRTRIRPHVIESIEVDDFAPCGGDFYARGHLRTLARVLGRDPAPLLAQFDNRYATAPINARRVFEAELATGMTGSMRRTVGGGPNWALLIGVVLALVMTWGVVRLFASEPPERLQSPVPVLNGSAGVDSRTNAGLGANPVVTPNPVRLTLVGAQDSSAVVVRDRTGKIVWAGEIVLGEKRTVRAVPPVKVQAKDAGAIEVAVNGRDKGPLGELGQPGRQTFLRPQAR